MDKIIILDDSPDRRNVGGGDLVVTSSVLSACQPTVKPKETAGQTQSEGNGTENGTSERKRLSGAGKKRMLKLLDQGIPEETARILAQKPLLDLKKEMNFGNKPFEVKEIKVSIMDENVRLTKPQMQQIQDLIMKEIVPNKSSSDRGPRFLNCVQKSEWLVITCADKFSHDWLEKIVYNLKPWEGAKLLFVEGDRSHRPITGKVWIPGLESNETILKRLEAQNKGLNTFKWKVLHRQDFEAAQTLIVCMDRESCQVLQEQENKAFLNFGQVTFKLKNSTKLFPPVNSINSKPTSSDERKKPRKRKPILKETPPKEKRQCLQVKSQEGLPSKSSQPNQPRVVGNRIETGQRSPCERSQYPSNQQLIEYPKYSDYINAQSEFRTQNTDYGNGHRSNIPNNQRLSRSCERQDSRRETIPDYVSRSRERQDPRQQNIPDYRQFRNERSDFPESNDSRMQTQVRIRHETNFQASHWLQGRTSGISHQRMSECERISNFAEQDNRRLGRSSQNRTQEQPARQSFDNGNFRNPFNFEGYERSRQPRSSQGPH